MPLWFSSFFVVIKLRKYTTVVAYLFFKLLAILKIIIAVFLQKDHLFDHHRPAYLKTQKIQAHRCKKGPW